MNLLKNTGNMLTQRFWIIIICKRGGFFSVFRASRNVYGRMGIRPQDKDKLFDRYYRVKSVHTKHTSGFGVGLYLSAEIIQLHDGRIWVESEKGVGSTFYFALPLPNVA